MAEVINMPKLSDTMEEGVIVKWVKKEGEEVSEGDLLAEIETDKATMDYESPNDGVILKIHAAQGKRVKIGEPICIIGEAGESVDTPTAKAKAPAEKEKSTTPTPAEKPAPQKETSTGTSRIKASPLARKIAEDRKIDLKGIQGSGPHGRIVLKDLEAVAGKNQKTEENKVSSPAAAVGGYEDIDLSMMRLTIAKRLTVAKNAAPHFYLQRSFSAVRLEEWRQGLNANAKDKSQKISMNDLFMLIVSRTLAAYPNINAAWLEGQDKIRQFKDVHLSFAVALPTGLITPVVKNCHQLGLREISAASKALVDRARSGQMKPEDYNGGTFTISNLGMMGIERFTAIINPPQAAILAIGATRAVPFVNEATNQISVDRRTELSLSCDHRVIDGAAGAIFLETLINHLEDPLGLLV